MLFHWGRQHQFSQSFERFHLIISVLADDIVGIAGQFAQSNQYDAIRADPFTATHAPSDGASTFAQCPVLDQVDHHPVVAEQLGNDSVPLVIVADFEFAIGPSSCSLID